MYVTQILKSKFNLSEKENYYFMYDQKIYITFADIYKTLDYFLSVSLREKTLVNKKRQTI